MTRKKNNKPIGITPGERIFDFINALFMLLLIFITIYPALLCDYGVLQRSPHDSAAGGAHLVGAGRSYLERL